MSGRACCKWIQGTSVSLLCAKEIKIMACNESYREKADDFSRSAVCCRVVMA